MINNETKQFGEYALGQLITLVSRSQGDAFLSTLASNVPGLDITAFRNQPVEQWQPKVSSWLVDYYAKKYEPGKLRTAG